MFSQLPVVNGDVTLRGKQNNKNNARIFLVSGRYISDPVKFVIVLF